MNVAFRPARPQDFDYCERLYFAEMERINRELKLDRDVQLASFRRQWQMAQVRIITLDDADIGCCRARRATAHFSSASFLSRRPGNGAASAPRSCIASSARPRVCIKP